MIYQHTENGGIYRSPDEICTQIDALRQKIGALDQRRQTAIKGEASEVKAQLVRLSDDIYDLRCELAEVLYAVYGKKSHA